jgi:quinolinate synthase
MKLTTLEKLLWALQDMAPEITIPEDIRVKALTAVTRMLEVG